MAFVVDGSNLLGHRAPGGHRDPEERIRLVSALLAFQRLTRTRILLVFDGPPDERLLDGRTTDKFDILFPPPGEKADGIIQDLIAAFPDRRHLILVTSDRELRAFARSRGASCRTAAEFDRRLKSALRQSRKARELDKPRESPSPLETQIWLDLFKNRKR
ncbi:MAG: NYN domain-containing protein [Candidatus Aminicenantes bacterium]|nr:NYN domain-containing protein [Candidatus Aminicenantes bacterium]